MYGHGVHNGIGMYDTGIILHSLLPGPAALPGLGPLPALPRNLWKFVHWAKHPGWLLRLCLKD